MEYTTNCIRKVSIAGQSFVPSPMRIASMPLAPSGLCDAQPTRACQDANSSRRLRALIARLITSIRSCCSFGAIASS